MTLPRLLSNINYNHCGSALFNLSLCFSKSEAASLTRKDQILTVHFNKAMRDSERRKSTAELMEKFDEMTFNIKIMCMTLKRIFNNIVITIASDTSNLESKKNECKQVLSKNFIYCLRRDTMNCKKQSLLTFSSMMIEEAS
jgi:hypothetical protein